MMNRALEAVSESTTAVAALPLETMAVLTGELNSEAHCAALLAVPMDRLTMVSDVSNTLRKAGAYDHVRPRRFNLHMALVKMHPALVSTLAEPASKGEQSKTWVRKSAQPVGTFATAYAGAMLGFSLDQAISPRILVGEKRNAPQGQSAIASRLTVLTHLYNAHLSSGDFTAREIFDSVADYGVSRSGLQRHLAGLSQHGIIEPVDPDSVILRMRPQGMEPKQAAPSLIVGSFLKLIAGFATNNPEAIQAGLARGQAIMADREALGQLVDRSFAASSHVNKTYGKQ